MKRSILLSIIFISSLLSLQASNVQVTNVSYTGDIGDDFYEVTFDISWENSWRTSTYESNHDAVWVFLKYNTSVENYWAPVRLNGSIQEPSDAELIFPSDQTGFFIQRGADGVGDVSFSSIVISWDLDFDFFVDETIEICVYAIEMVYIPEGPFQLGDGSSNGRFRSGDSSIPFEVLSEGALTLGGTSLANLSSDGFDDFSSVITQNLPAQYPKGFQAFYIMKYEISQGQYAAFLSSVPFFCASVRFPDHYGDSGNTIRAIGLPIKYIADSPERAANYLNWGDLAEYSDWAGLRPMSELEYEKACRGPLPAIANEYAWGTSTLYDVPYSYSDQNGPEETIIGGVEGLGNCMSFFTNNTSPRRCGIFAASYDSPNRMEAGASYYGVLELSGNVWEATISVGSPEGRVFNGNIHGDGLLWIELPASWPPIDSPVDGGGTLRGGGFLNVEVSFRVSDRSGANYLAVIREASFGGRLVRSDF